MRKHFIFITTLILLVLPKLTQADSGFVPLVGIPFLDTDNKDPNGDTSIAGYVNNLYIATISIAAIIAVVRIILAGVQYMLSDIVTDKTKARKSIQNSLLGLVIIVAAVLVLTTINPALKNIDVFGNLPGFTVKVGQYEVSALGENEAAKKCKEYGENNCKFQTCDAIESEKWTISWFLTDPVNRIQCSARCAYLGGEIFGRNATETGICVYPIDKKIAEENEDKIKEGKIDEISDETLKKLTELKLPTSLSTTISANQLEEFTKNQNVYNKDLQNKELIAMYEVDAMTLRQNKININSFASGHLQNECKKIDINATTVVPSEPPTRSTKKIYCVK